MDTEVTAAVLRHFPTSSVKRVTRYEKGIMNATFKVEMSSPANLVVYRSYSREGWKAAKEQYLYKLIRDRTTVPVPEVLAKGKDYSILSHISGSELDVRDKKLVFEAGALLAKIHSLRMPSFGWIVGNTIEPSFSDWEAFLRFDTQHKLSKLPHTLEHTEIENRVMKMLDTHSDLLTIDSAPCLVHKDYHASHILVVDGAISGVIDVEWAIAGHHELDLVKSCEWMFSGSPMEDVFLDGYRSVGTISSEYEKRKKLYTILILLSSLVISYDCNNREKCDENRDRLQKLLGI
ncbi:MAG: aminoglycoside phosphotransferase family protein [Nanoarchaeota archaeon]|nr:aminoglycoside phosphotransferase family protein [Nanoarchaeota archaeon]